MIEYIRLDCLIIGPGLIIAEDIDLDWEAMGGGLQVADQKGHGGLVNFGMVLQIGDNISPENTYVGLSSAIAGTL